jgi:Holliday junction DNA helicase RuvB
LQFYTPPELARIVMAAGRKLGADLTVDGAEEIAGRARGTPRIAVRLLRRVRDFAEAEDSKIDKAAAARALKRLEIDEDGLDALDRRYLDALVRTYAGGPVGADTLAAALSEARDAVEEVIEPYLMQKGYVARTPRGRVAAPLAYERLGLPIPGGAQQGMFEGK